MISVPGDYPAPFPLDRRWLTGGFFITEISTSRRPCNAGGSHHSHAKSLNFRQAEIRPDGWAICADEEIVTIEIVTYGIAVVVPLIRMQFRHEVVDIAAVPRHRELHHATIIEEAAPFDVEAGAAGGHVQ